MTRFSLRRWFAWAVLVCCLAGPGSVASAAVQVGDKPELKMVTMDRKPLTSEHLSGKIVILEFWATWCPPCRAMVPHLKQLVAEHADDGVVLISITLDDSANTARRFIQSQGMRWTHVHDDSQRQPLAGRFGVSGIPHALLLSPDGEVLWRGHPNGLDTPLQQALRDHPPTLDKPEDPDGFDDTAGTTTGEQALAALERAAAHVQAAAEDGAWAEHMPRAWAELASVPRDRLIEVESARAAQPIHGVFDGLSLDDFREIDHLAGDHPEGWAKMKYLLHRLGYTPPKLQAVPEQVMRAKRRSAERAEESGDWLKAYDAFRWLALRGDEEAEARVAAFEADAEKMATIEAERAERAAKELLGMAKAYANAGRSDEARECLEKLLAKYPDAPQADEASGLLAGLDG